ncbi:MAG: hypothetical protein QXS54_08930 [Candidatus Methanomethylicaceae archaeon]
MLGVYCYWEGETRHWYYDLCLETIKRHNPDLVVLSRTDIEAELGPLPDELNNVYITHRVDWIRKVWIATVGGLWLDCDFVCWSSLDWLRKMAEAFDYVGYQEWHGTGWMDNIFAGRKGSVILRDAAEYALQQIRAHGNAMPWLAASAHAMNHAINLHRWGYYLQIPTYLLSPVSVMDKNWFAQKVAKNIKEFNAFGQITSFHVLGDWIKSTFASAESLLLSDTHLAHVLLRGLGD